MELMRFMTAGSVDDGKSTLIGRLLYDSKSIFQDQLDAVERAMLPDVVKKAVHMVTDVITLGTTPAMNRHHAKPKAPPKAPKAP